MKKTIFATLLLGLGLASTANAQIQQGNWMVGAQVADVKFTNGFTMSLTPQVGYFVKDNWAVGGRVNVSVADVTDGGTSTNIDLGAFTRYYLGSGEIAELTKNGRFFAQGDVGFSGINQSHGATTNGVGLGIGAGYAYFITPNVGLEGLLRFAGVAGGGNSNFNGNLGLGIGFQIYLPGSKAKQAIQGIN